MIFSILGIISMGSLPSGRITPPTSKLRPKNKNKK
jgi:hypothetical protein